MSTVVCPNCGANTTNLYNCEYCGSILVRYVAAGKEVDNQTFGKEVHIISGLAEALGKNLSLQKIKNENDVVLTEIITPDQTVMQVIDTPNCNIGILTANPFGEGHEGEIALRIPFETMSEDNGFAEGEKLRLSWFKQQDYYFMFTRITTEALFITSILVRTVIMQLNYCRPYYPMRWIRRLISE